MKTMFKKNGKRVLSAALCLLMAVMSLPLSAFAWTSEEGRSCTSSFGDYYVGLDGEYYRSQATMHTLVYNDDGSTYVKSYSSGNAKRKYLMTDNSGTHQVYCVESGIDFNTDNTYTSKSGQNSSYFKNLPTDAQFGVMMALMYGWHEGKSSPVAGTNADDYAYATQSIIWEYQQQLRTSPADLHSARLVTNLFKATTPKGSQSQDPFWDTAASMLLLSLVFYLKYEAPPEEQNFPMVMELLRAGEVREDDDSYVSPLDELFDRLEMVNPEHIALKYYRDYHSGSAKTLKSIQITLAARLEKFNLESLASLTATDELDLPSLGEKKVALFALIPDNDTSFNFLVSILYTQLFQQLFYLADHKYGGSLPVHCHFIMDEFANGVTRSTPKTVGITDKSVA